MKEVRAELRIKNNILWHAIYDGYGDTSKFCRLFKLHNTTVGNLINLKVSPFRKPGRWGDRFEKTDLFPGSGYGTVPQKLSMILNISLEELFPPRLYKRCCGNFFVRELGLNELGLTSSQMGLPLTPHEALERKEMIESIEISLDMVLSSSSDPRERKVIEMLYGLGGETEHTLGEVGTELRVSKERVRQMKSHVLRRMRHPSFSRRIREMLRA